MADLLGLEQQQAQQETTTDYLGQKVPVSFRNQPALPTGIGGPSAAGVSAAPPSVAGGGTTAPEQPAGPSEFGALAGAAIPGTTEGGGEAGPGEGSPVGQGIDVAGGPTNIGLGFGIGPGRVSVGPTGTISVSARGESPMTSALASGLNTALSALGIPTSVNLPSLISSLVGSSALGIAAQLAGAAGIPMTIASLAHGIASMDPTSVTSLQAALADPNPETQVSAAQALAIASGGAFGPTVGGAQPIGRLNFDNPVTNVAASTQAPPTTPATLAELAAALGLGTSGPTGPGPTGSPGSEGPAGLGEGGPPGGGETI